MKSTKNGHWTAQLRKEYTQWACVLILFHFTELHYLFRIVARCSVEVGTKITHNLLIPYTNFQIAVIKGLS